MLGIHGPSDLLLAIISWLSSSGLTIFIELKYVIIIMAHREIRGRKSAIFILYLHSIRGKADCAYTAYGHTDSPASK